MGLSGSGDGQQFEAAGGRCSGAPRSHCPSPGQRDPLRAPPGPTSLGDSVSDKRRKPPQVQATDSGASTCQGPRWPGAGLVGNALICPESQIKVPVSALPGSRSPCPPSHNQSPQVHPSPVKIPTHKPPSRNKMEQSPSNPGTVPGSDPAHGRFRHLPPKSGEAPRLGRPRGPDGHTCTARCPLQPRWRHRATLSQQDPRQGCDWGLSTGAPRSDAQRLTNAPNRPSRGDEKQLAEGPSQPLRLPRGASQRQPLAALGARGRGRRRHNSREWGARSHHQQEGNKLY